MKACQNCFSGDGAFRRSHAIVITKLILEKSSAQYTTQGQCHQLTWMSFWQSRSWWMITQKYAYPFSTSKDTLIKTNQRISAQELSKLILIAMKRRKNVLRAILHLPHTTPGSWISTRVDKAMQMVPSTIAQAKYLVTRLRIQESTIPDIDSEVIAAARSNHSWPRLAQTSKMTNYWLPVHHNWKHNGAE
jgi:hypothetical protein